jgi:hypothetical protein
MSHSYRIATAIYTLLLLTAAQVWAQGDSEPAAISSLNGVRLPAGALRLNDELIPAEIAQTLDKLVALGGGKLRKGDSEVLVWGGSGYRRSDAPQLVKTFTASLQSGGWTYAVGEQNAEFTVFNSLNNTEKRGVIGFWTAKDESMLLAWTEMIPTGPQYSSASKPLSVAAPPSATPTAGSILRVGKDDGYVNVMGTQMPPIPEFAPLKPRPGFVRGYVKDWTGKPLANAAIGVRASYFARHYSGAQGRTDARGYYEFAVPKGLAHFYNAGYAMDWGGGLAAIGLHPADGQLDSWVTSDGAVENFVLLPYGVANKANSQDNPRNPGSYYGGSIYISYGALEAGDTSPYAGYVPENSTIEITLVSDTGKSFVIHKKAGFQSLFRINNIPLGRYKISAKVNGKSLNLKQGGIVDEKFGLAPRETRGEATLTFAPDTAQSEMVAPQSGAWKPVEISITMP